MNINEPVISQVLAILIQNIANQDRGRFLKDAEESKSIEDFIQGLDSYEVLKEG